MDPLMCYKTVHHVFLHVLCSERITCLCTISLLIIFFRSLLKSVEEELHQRYDAVALFVSFTPVLFH